MKRIRAASPESMGCRKSAAKLTGAGKKQLPDLESFRKSIKLQGQILSRDIRRARTIVRF
ncbi:MAG: hypothetical protein ACRD3D_12470 [Terriglobia bacterium]